MGLNNVHVWSDGETITHDDLNSISNGVAEALGSGGLVGGGGISWPLVAQGNIDMNGYGILNADLAYGVKHVNVDNPLQTVLTNAISGDVIMLDPGNTTTITAKDIQVSGKSHITIVGFGESTSVSVATDCATAGIIVDTLCTDIVFSGIHFIAGTTGKPAIAMADGNRNKAVACTFGTPYGVVVGTTSSISLCGVDDCLFDACTVGLVVNGAEDSSFSNNRFNNCATAAIFPGDGDNSFSQCNILDNIVSGNSSGVGFVGSWTGTQDVTRGQCTFSGNKMSGLSGKSIDLSGYYENIYSNNIVGTDSTIEGKECVIEGNISHSTVAFDLEDCKVCNNIFEGAVTGSGSGNTVNGNTMVAAFTIDTWIDVFIGNTLLGTVTETAKPTGSYGLNVGW